MSNLTLNLNKFYEQIVLFNKAAGNSPEEKVTPAFWLTVKNQHLRQLEEAEETTAAINSYDKQEFLDGIVDEFVVLMGKLFMAECAGFDVESAVSRICENNLEKVTTDPEVAVKWLNEQSGVRMVESTVDGTTYFSIKRNSDNKIMKHLGFKNVDISDCVPKENI